MHRDLPCCGDRGTGGIGGIDQDLHLAESGNEFAHRVSQLQLALFNHHHGQHRHHGLGHGIGTKHTVTLQGFARGRVLQTDRFSMDHRAFASDQKHRAGHTLCIDFSLNDGAYASQTLRHHALRGWLCRRQISGACRPWRHACQGKRTQ